MGAWGTALYSDDVALDVRDLYKELLGEGYSNEIVTKSLVRICKEQIEDEEDGPVFWLALADTQWKCGRLMDEEKSWQLRLLIVVWILCSLLSIDEKQFIINIKRT